jgi:hypothetical protein
MQRKQIKAELSRTLPNKPSQGKERLNDVPSAEASLGIIMCEDIQKKISSRTQQGAAKNANPTEFIGPRSLDMFRFP